MTEKDWDAISQAHLASLKRDMKKSFEDATVRAVLKVMGEFEARLDERLMQPPSDFIDALKYDVARRDFGQTQTGWKLVPTNPTEEMLKAMDECSKEGYDERLYAGHAASVYMAAVDAAPTVKEDLTVPPREWVRLTEEEIDRLRHLIDWTAGWSYAKFARAIEALCKEKNHG